MSKSATRTGGTTIRASLGEGRPPMGTGTEARRGPAGRISTRAVALLLFAAGLMAGPAKAQTLGEKVQSPAEKVQAPAAKSPAPPADPGAPAEAPKNVETPAAPGESPTNVGTPAVPPIPAVPTTPGAEEPGADRTTSGGSGGLLQKMARGLLGKKTEKTEEAIPNIPGMAPSPAEEEGVEPENQETQKRAKELARLALQNIEKKRISEAKKNINDLISLKPYDVDYHLALGLCFRQEKRYKDAFKKYQDVLDLGGPKSLVNLLRAEAAGADGEKEKVFEFLREAAVGGRNIVQDVQKLSLLERYKTDTEFIKLALQLEKFEVTSKKNQDPFTNPFPASVQSGPKLPTAPTGPLVLDPRQQQDMLSEARRLFEKVQWYIKLEDETKAMENYIRLKEIIDKKDLLTLPRIANDFRILMGRMENLETQIEGIRLKYYWNQAQARLKDLKDAFQATEYARVDSIFNEVDKLTREMEKSNVRFKPVAERILAAAKVWQNRSHVRKEFQNAKPEIQGVVISEDAKLAIIDNRVLRQGERFGDFFLQKVENNRVTFRYKGEEIPLIFRRY